MIPSLNSFQPIAEHPLSWSWSWKNAHNDYVYIPLRFWIVLVHVVLAAILLTQQTAWEVSIDFVIKAPPEDVFRFIKEHPEFELKYHPMK